MKQKKIKLFLLFFPFIVIALIALVFNIVIRYYIEPQYSQEQVINEYKNYEKEIQIIGKYFAENPTSKSITVRNGKKISGVEEVDNAIQLIIKESIFNRVDVSLEWIDFETNRKEGSKRNGIYYFYKYPVDNPKSANVYCKEIEEIDNHVYYYLTDYEMKP